MFKPDLVEKLWAMADPARNSNEHERAAAMSVLKRMAERWQAEHGARPEWADVAPVIDTDSDPVDDLQRWAREMTDRWEAWWAREMSTMTREKQLRWMQLIEDMKRAEAWRVAEHDVYLAKKTAKRRAARAIRRAKHRVALVSSRHRGVELNPAGTLDELGVDVAPVRLTTSSYRG